MTTLVKTWLDNAILQSVAESYLDLLPRFGTDNLSLDLVLSQGVNHPKLNPAKKWGQRRISAKKWGQRRISINFTDTEIF